MVTAARRVINTARRSARGAAPDRPAQGALCRRAPWDPASPQPMRDPCPVAGAAAGHAPGCAATRPCSPHTRAPRPRG
jgi:hypothetical protein